MAERATVGRFLDAYRAAFEMFDVEAIADLFSYPWQVTSDAGEVTVTTVETREAWLPQVDRLVATYREIGVHSADVVALHIGELSPLLVQATVHWGLAAADGQPIYDFNASYTLAARGAGPRITAVAHNEMRRLQAVVERQRRS